MKRMSVIELMLIGAGFGIFITPNSTAIIRSVDRRLWGVASGMIGAMRTLGMAVSLTTIPLVFSHFVGNQTINREYTACVPDEHENRTCCLFDILRPWCAPIFHEREKSGSTFMRLNT